MRPLPSTDASLPAEIEVRLPAGAVRVPAGTPIRDVLGETAEGGRVVAGLLEGKAVSLATPIAFDAAAAPLTAAHFEGRRILRASAALLLLEAARRLDPALRVRIGASVGYGDLVEVEGALDARARGDLATRLTGALRDLAAERPPIRVEAWPLEAARARLREQGWDGAERLLRTWRDATVPLARCGGLHALGMGPLLPSPGELPGLTVLARDGGLVLVHGEGPPPPDRPGADRAMALDHERWLAALGATSVGAFNDLCISGQVSEIIRVAEGFHEKRIAAIADEIAARGRGVRVISVAGPSSSGKTTFLKRLTVQLRIHGIGPVGVSLDDYYVDRERTARDARGEYDYEAIEAIDLALFERHLRRLLAGETVTTARYDFLTGKSLPEGGPRITLGARDVLVIEGIHGLNPRLLGAAVPEAAVFRIFIDPTTTLRFDPLTRVSAADLRLIRRIVRDRVRRGLSAAVNIARWPAVRAGERTWIFPFEAEADAVFDSSLVYEPSVLKVYADRYLLEVPRDHPSFVTAFRLRQLTDRFVTIYPDHVPPTSILREFIGGSGFEY